MSYLVGKWSAARTHTNSCSPDTKVSFSSLDCYVKWIIDVLHNPKQNLSKVDTTQPSAYSSKWNRFGRKVVLCVWWDQQGIVYDKLLKLGETVSVQSYEKYLFILNSSILDKYLFIGKDVIRWFFFTTTYHCSRLFCSRTTYNLSTWGATPLRVLNVPFFFSLPNIFGHGSHNLRVAFSLICISTNVAWWVLFLEGKSFLVWCLWST